MRWEGWALLVYLAAFLVCAPAQAQEQIWSHGTEEFILQGQFQRDEGSGHWASALTGAWAHFVTDNVQIGAVTTVLREGGDGGYGAGPFYEYNFPTTAKGHFFVGGDVQALAGDFSDAAAAQAASRIGYKIHVGNSSAIRLALEGKRAIDPDDSEAAESLNQVGFTVGFSMGVNRNTAVN